MEVSTGRVKELKCFQEWEETSKSQDNPRTSNPFEFFVSQVSSRRTPALENSWLFVSAHKVSMPMNSVAPQIHLYLTVPTTLSLLKQNDAHIPEITSQTENIEGLCFVVHCAPLNLDKIITEIGDEWKTEIFQETYFAIDLIRKGEWIQQKNSQEWSKKTKKFIQHNFLCYTEQQDQEQTEKDLSSLGKLQPYVTFHVTRKTLELDGVQFYIDCSRTDQDAIAGINNFYLSCGVRASAWNSIDNLFKKFGFSDKTELYPLPSKVMEFVYNNHPKMLTKKGKKAISQFNDYRIRYYRNADPFDPKMALSIHANEQQVQAWCKNRIDLEDVGHKFAQVAAGMNAKDLYEAAPQDLGCISENLFGDAIFGFALFFYVHLWQSSISREPQQLLSETQDIDAISNFTFHELRQLIQMGRELLGDEVYEECCEQANLLCVMKNLFVQWQIQNKQPVIYV